MLNVADEVAGAAAALERVCVGLRPQLEAEAAWRALQQLDDRERQGDTVSAIDRSMLRERLSRELDGRIPGWRLLAGAEAALRALTRHGLTAGSAAKPEVAGVAVDEAASDGSGEDVEAILRRIRSIAAEPASSRVPADPAPTTPSFGGRDEPMHMSEAPPPRPRSVPVRTAPAPPSPDDAPLPVARVERLEAELDVLLEGGLPAARRTDARDAEPAPVGSGGQEASWPASWSGSRHELVEEAEVEIIASSAPLQHRTQPDERPGGLRPLGRLQADRARSLADIVDEASVEIIQLDVPGPSSRN